jgi:hypothetical protein
VSSPNLAIPHILQSQAQKEVTANEAFDRLDEALNDRATIDVSAGNSAVSAEDFRRNVLLVLTGTPAAPLDLTVPASKRLFIVENASGQDVTVTTGAGAQVILTGGQRRLLYGDGTNVVAVAPDFASTGGGAAGGALYDLGFYYAGGPPGSFELLFMWVATRNLELAADMAGSFGDIGTNPTASFDLDATLEGASIGTISVATDGTFTFTTAGGTAKQIAAGERLAIVAPASADATAADIALTLAATIVA